MELVGGLYVWGRQLYGAVVCMGKAGRLIVRVSGPAEPPIVFGIVHWYFSSCIYGVLVDAFGMVEMLLYFRMIILWLTHLGCFICFVCVG